MDHDRPYLYKHEKRKVGELLEREDKREDVVGQALAEAVYRMESMACERARHDPLVMRLVDMLVDQRVVKPTVYPVNAKVREDEEERELEHVVPSTHTPWRVSRQGVIDLAVSAHFCDEERHCEYGHDGYSVRGLLDLESDLVLEELRVVERVLIEYEGVGQAGADKVDRVSEDPAIV